MEIFGPIPSRRLGRSLGINNIPSKSCSYACTYCQVGAGTTSVKQRGFYAPEYLAHLVKERVALVKAQGDTIDYLSFVPDGEPTLDTRLSETIDLLRPLGIKIAIISNASLIWRAEIRATLNKADWVSLKLDTVNEAIWQRLNKAHTNLQLSKILAGMLTFAQEFTGILATDTMLVKGVNTSVENAEGVANFLVQLKPQKSYILLPTRPPAEIDVSIPSEAELIRFYEIVSRQIPQLECLGQYEGNAFTATGDAANDLLSITAVHPLREEAVKELLVKNQADWSVVETLMQTGKLKTTEYLGTKFYLTKI